MLFYKESGITAAQLIINFATAEPPDTTTDMHFGGFLTKNEGGTAKHLSGKDVMDEIVAKSKLQKVS